MLFCNLANLESQFHALSSLFYLFFGYITAIWPVTSTIFELNAHLYNAATLSFTSIIVFLVGFIDAVVVSTLDKWLFPLFYRCCRTAPKPGVRWSCTGEPHPVLTLCVSLMCTRTCTRAASAYSLSWSGESYVCYSHAYRNEWMRIGRASPAQNVLLWDSAITTFDIWVYFRLAQYQNWFSMVFPVQCVILPRYNA